MEDNKTSKPTYRYYGVCMTPQRWVNGKLVLRVLQLIVQQPVLSRK